MPYADETGVGYTKIHALKTALHEAVNGNGIPAEEQGSTSQIPFTNLQK